jgi:SAM-dependent methyltransferase
VLGGERLPFEDATFDCIVSTFTLCSIEQADQAVREVYRVLEPGGKFLFLEHGLSSELNVQKWQRRLNSLQVWLAGGCHLDRDMRALDTAQPFTSVQMDEFYIEKASKTHGYMYRGGRHDVGTPRSHEDRPQVPAASDELPGACRRSRGGQPPHRGGRTFSVALW